MRRAVSSASGTLVKALEAEIIQHIAASQAFDHAYFSVLLREAVRTRRNSDNSTAFNISV